jgi:hypothetical protein
MNDTKLRAECLKAAARLATSPHDLLRVALAFEAYAFCGYSTGIEMLKPNFGIPQDQPAPAAVPAQQSQGDASGGTWLDPLPNAIRYH